MKIDFLSIFQRLIQAKTFYIPLFLLALSSYGSPKKPLILSNSDYIYTIDSTYFVQMDSTASGFIETGRTLPSLHFTNPDTDLAYWYRFSITNQTPALKEWLIVSYNYAMDEIDLLIQDSSGRVEKQTFRDSIGIYQRKIVHKQPVFNLELLPGETKTIYLKLKDKHSYSYVFAVFSQNKFFSHFFIEYLLYGVFYGIMAFVIVYSILNVLFFKDRIFVLYTLFITAQVLHMMFRDGTGLFLLPENTDHADTIKHISRAALAVFLLLYTAYFLKVDKKTRLFRIIVGLSLLRLVYLILFWNDPANITFHMELFVILFCTVLSAHAFSKGFEDAKYMSIGLGLLTASYFVYYLSIFGFTSLARVGFFGLYYGVAAESLFMTIALTERFKRIKVDNFKKGQMNRELEALVEQRTQTISEQTNMIAERSDELNLFLYSVSHDLKGPIKTIQGLCHMGTIDKDADHIRIYDLIAHKLKNLESNINDLKLVSTLKNSIGDDETLDIQQLHDEMMKRFAAFPGFFEISVTLKIKLKDPIRGNAFAIRCIYQNIFENAIKFRDSTKSSFLKITVSESDTSWKIVFEDNGEGINKETLPNIFNMFYRASENSRDDTGMGLYIVKLAVEKLGGTISAESTPEIGTVITAIFPLPSI